MRLLNTTTKKLEDFGVNPPRYAILSHRWLDEEVTFRDMSRHEVDETRMKGYAKLSAACDVTRSLGFLYLWMDTCCIDKSSSSELSESINSMYTWYGKTLMCIVYLNDVRKDRWRDEFCQSEWFRRGWTLQELIAPMEVLFIDKDWKILDTKRSLVDDLADITGIDKDVLLAGDVRSVSVAAKMSWAAKRITTRLEDRAYSLMGIFDVNMPTIYGEGDKAFIRLQEEIIKKSSDHSIFAWSGRCLYTNPEVRRQCFRRQIYTNAPRLETGSQGYGGLLATSPSRFQGMNDVVQIPLSSLEAALHVDSLDADFTMTNHGIRICLPVQLLDRELKIYVAFLACGCGSPSTDSFTVFAIYLRQLSDNRYTRPFLSSLLYVGLYDLVEIPVKTIVPSDIRTSRSLFVDGPGEALSQEISANKSSVRVAVDFSHLESVLPQWKFTLFNASWDTEIHRSFYLFEHDSNTNSQQETFFIVKNEFEELLLVVTSKLTWTNNGRTQSDVGVRAITLGPDGLLGAKHARSSNDIYKTCCQRAKTDNLPASSWLATAKVSNGQEIMFTLIRAPRFMALHQWSLFAILRGSQDESKLIS